MVGPHVVEVLGEGGVYGLKGAGGVVKINDIFELPAMVAAGKKGEQKEPKKSTAEAKHSTKRYEKG